MTYDRRDVDALLRAGLLTRRELGAHPTMIGRYEVQRLLGSGATADVYLATDPLIHRQVAVKVLRLARRIERFHAEMVALGNLRHPGIVEIFDAGEWGERLYFVMAYAGERTLAEADLPLREGVEVLEQVALACHAAHEAGIVHRDLKPSNVVLGERPVVVDFGVARFVDAVRLSAEGAAIGTPSYMAPEQLAGGEVGPATDVWALGVMLYELLTGTLPFEGEDLVSLGAQVLQQQPIAPRRRSKGVPRELEAAALRALVKDPAGRFGSAQEFARTLRAWLDRSPAPARTRRRSFAFAVAAGVAAAGLVALVAVALLVTRSAPSSHLSSAPSSPPSLPPSSPPPAAVVDVAACISAMRVELAASDFAAVLAEADRAPTSAEVMVLRAQALSGLGRAADAEAACRRALELDPGCADARWFMGELQLMAGDVEGSLASATRACELDARHARAHRLRGAVRHRLGDTRGALADLDHALVLDPDHGPSWQLRGFLRLMAGEDAGAVADLTRSLELPVDDPVVVTEALYYRAIALYRQRAPAAEVMADLDRAIALAPAAPWGKLRMLRGALRAENGDLRGAEEDLAIATTTMASASERAEARRALAKLRARPGRGQ